jgi:sterol desaturase/sphingolipid hydroxylase (fatty acid hydroxylase superfamily)
LDGRKGQGRELTVKHSASRLLQRIGGLVFALEHSKAAYWVDFLVYVAVIGGLTLCLCILPAQAHWPTMLALAVAGLAAWSLVEYAMHRFVLHGLDPFKTWHAKHHERPSALISAPTALSAALIMLLVFIPALTACSVGSAVSLTLGVTAGYLAYGLCHHATHHWRANGNWLKERKRWHAIHHRRAGRECYGVTSTLWDRVFRTGPETRR